MEWALWKLLETQALCGEVQTLLTWASSQYSGVTP